MADRTPPLPCPDVSVEEAPWLMLVRNFSFPRKRERERETLIPSKNEPTSLESKKPEDDETGSGSRRDTDNLSLENEFWNYSSLIELYEDN